MALYSRRQLVLLLVVVAVAGAGLAVGHWRRAHPELAARLEQLEVPPSHDVESRGAAAPPRDEPQARQQGTSHERPDRPSRDGEVRAPAGTRVRSDAGRPGSKRSFGQALQPLDLNRATGVELTRLPGVGPVLAERILAARDASGAFQSVDDLRRVRGVGSVKLERFRALVTVERSPSGDPMVH